MAPRAITWYVWATVGLAIVCFGLIDWEGFAALPESARWGLIALTFLGVASEAFAVSREGGDSASRVSLTFLPLIAACLLFGQVGAVLFIGITEAVTETLIRRKDRLKATFNVAQSVVAAALAGWVFYLLGGEALALHLGTDNFHPHVLPVLAFGFVALITNHIAVSIALVLTRPTELKDVVLSSFSRIGGTVLYDIAVLPIALLIAFLYYHHELGGLVVSILPLIFIRHAYGSKYRVELANRDLLDALVTAIETRDPYTSGHARRVQDLAARIGKEIRLGPKRMEELKAAALLHDIGKIEVVYENILKKPSQLTPEEHKIMQSHVHRGVEILKSMSSLNNRVIEAVRHHHELYNGRGYPDKLKGDDIPLFGRIIKLSDAVDAMLSDRPYRSALSLDEVRQELERCKGTDFDPKLAKVVIETRLLEEHHNQIRLEQSIKPSVRGASFVAD